jgi:diacylglycerol kinase
MKKNKNNRFRMIDRIKSVGYAVEGVKTFFKTQHNAWIHLFFALIVLIAGILMKVNLNEWCWLVVSIGLVYITEMINTAVEFLTDLVSPQIHPLAKKVKDVSAAAVLIAAVTSVIIGLIIFVPKFLKFDL